jgi:hypothetical protein
MSLVQCTIDVGCEEKHGFEIIRVGAFQTPRCTVHGEHLLKGFDSRHAHLHIGFYASIRHRIDALGRMLREDRTSPEWGKLAETHWMCANTTLSPLSGSFSCLQELSFRYGREWTALMK